MGSENNCVRMKSPGSCVSPDDGVKTVSEILDSSSICKWMIVQEDCRNLFTVTQVENDLGYNMVTIIKMTGF